MEKLTFEETVHMPCVCIGDCINDLEIVNTA